jgi:xylulokinase
MNALVGLSDRHGRGQLCRAVLEGVAYGLRDSLDGLRDVGVETRGGRASDGGARRPILERAFGPAGEPA